VSSFVVVGRLPASAILPEGEVLLVSAEVETLGPVMISLRTRYLEVEGQTHPLPAGVQFEVLGEAPDIGTAASAFWNAAGSFVPCISLCSNAFFSRPECELAFEQSAHHGERAFFQRFVPEDRIIPFPPRFIHHLSTTRFISSLASHKHKGRLNRAITQYYHALTYWRPGDELLALAHLFMAAEALAKCSLDQHLKETGTTKKDLSNLWQVEEKHLTSAARRRLVFKGDDCCHRAAKNASDAFEHGFKDYHELRPLAAQYTVKSAGYVREAVVALSGVCPVSAAVLLSRPFDRPLGPLQLETYLWGKLIGDVEDPAAEGQAYPIMQWKSGIKSYTRSSDGTYLFKPEHTITPRLANEVRFRGERMEVWDGSTMSEEPLSAKSKHDI